jgi:hypothetical protein
MIPSLIITNHNIESSHYLAFASRAASLVPIRLITFGVPYWLLLIELDYVLIGFKLLLFAFHLILELLCLVPLLVEFPLRLPHLLLSVSVIGLHAGDHGGEGG